MLSRSQAREVHRFVARMERSAIIAGLRRFPARFPIDLTDEWLASRPIEELRHVFAAICIQCDVRPQDPARAA